VDEVAEQRPTKQVIVIRRDLKMRRGKEIAQGAHASTAWLAERVLGHGPLARIPARRDRACDVRRR